MPQSAWSDFCDRRNNPTQRPLEAYTIDVRRLPDCDFRSPDYDELTDWYWRVSLNGIPINGGLTTGPSKGRSNAVSAIHQFEWVEFKEKNIFDLETGRWYRRGELPALECLCDMGRSRGSSSAVHCPFVAEDSASLPYG
jgi:hypothetical protein